MGEIESSPPVAILCGLRRRPERGDSINADSGPSAAKRGRTYAQTRDGLRSLPELYVQTSHRSQSVQKEEDKRVFLRGPEHWHTV